MEFDSMVVYRTWMEAIENLDDADAGKVMKAFMRYGMDGVEPEDLPPALIALFLMAKGNIDSNNKKRENGAKGGSISKQKASKEKQSASKPKQTEAKRKQTASNEDVDEDVDVNEDNIKTSSPPKPAQSDVQFEFFWAEYPKKVGKKAAYAAWKKAKVTAKLMTEIMDALDEQKSSDQWKKDGGQYIPNPATWLNQGRWDDEVPKTRAPARRNSFNNFSQRSRTQEDYDELERKFLGVKTK